MIDANKKSGTTAGIRYPVSGCVKLVPAPTRLESINPCSSWKQIQGSPENSRTSTGGKQALTLESIKGTGAKNTLHNCRVPRTSSDFFHRLSTSI
jgi:hypothetical protein